MIVVDSSVWIAKLRGSTANAVRKLEAIRETEQIAVGDIVLLEVLQGARDDENAAYIEGFLSRFTMVRVVDFQIVGQAAVNFRILRAKGFRVRATVDLLIGTYCIENGHVLLHDDRDFSVMEEHLGLIVL